MLLCLVHEADLSIRWLRAAVPDLVVITQEQLVSEIAFEHHQHDSTTATMLRTVDDMTIDSASIDGACCRLHGVDWRALEAFGLSDHDAQYASAEWNASLISWLHALDGRLVNRPAPHGLAGTWRTAEQWAVLAAECGVEVEADDAPVELRIDEAIVIGRRVYSHDGLDDRHIAQFLDLAACVGAGTMGFSSSDGLARRPIRNLLGNPTPDLSRVGSAGHRAFRAAIGADS